MTDKPTETFAYHAQLRAWIRWEDEAGEWVPAPDHKPRQHQLNCDAFTDGRQGSARGGSFLDAFTSRVMTFFGV